MTGFDPWLRIHLNARKKLNTYIKTFEDSVSEFRRDETNSPQTWTSLPPKLMKHINGGGRPSARVQEGGPGSLEPACLPLLCGASSFPEKAPTAESPRGPRCGTPLAAGAERWVPTAGRLGGRPPPRRAAVRPGSLSSASRVGRRAYASVAGKSLKCALPRSPTT